MWRIDRGEGLTGVLVDLMLFGGVVAVGLFLSELGIPLFES